MSDFTIGYDDETPEFMTLNGPSAATKVKDEAAAATLMRLERKDNHHGTVPMTMLSQPVFENMRDKDVAPPAPIGSPMSPQSLEMSRKKTKVERDVEERIVAARGFTRHLPAESELPVIHAYMPPTLEHALFCGHLVTDMDSIAGAIGAAELYGGKASRASEVNSETAFALEYWDVSQPPTIEEMLEKHPDAGVCLVDHQQTSQLNKSIPVDRIVGVIDHHALQNSTIVTDHPIYIDIRPWGSMSTIIAHSFMMYRRRPTVSTAGLLLCAILSDTLNLQGPTTTEWDKLMVTVLTDIAHVDDVQLLASRQFKAKSSELATLSAAALVTGDQKVFTFKTDVFEGSVGFAVIETTDDIVIMERAEEIRSAIAEDKKEKGLSMLYLAVVNIVELQSHLIIVDENEMALAKLAFPDGDILNYYTINLGTRVSRKMDFIPAITRAVKDGFTAQVVNKIKKSKSDVFVEDFHMEQDSHAPRSPGKEKTKITFADDVKAV